MSTLCCYLLRTLLSHEKAITLLHFPNTKRYVKESQWRKTDALRMPHYLSIHAIILPLSYNQILEYFFSLVWRCCVCFVSSFSCILLTPPSLVTALWLISYFTSNCHRFFMGELCIQLWFRLHFSLKKYWGVARLGASLAKLCFWCLRYSKLSFTSLIFFFVDVHLFVVLVFGQQLVDVANKLGPSLQVGESLVWEGSNAGPQPSRATQPDSQSPSAPDSVASSSASFQDDGSFV